MPASQQNPNPESYMSDDEYRQALRHFAGGQDESWLGGQEPEEQLPSPDEYDPM